MNISDQGRVRWSGHILCLDQDIDSRIMGNMRKLTSLFTSKFIRASGVMPRECQLPKHSLIYSLKCKYNSISLPMRCYLFNPLQIINSRPQWEINNFTSAQFRSERPLIVSWKLINQHWTNEDLRSRVAYLRVVANCRPLLHNFLVSPPVSKFTKYCFTSGRYKT